MAIDLKQALKAAKVSDGAWGTELDKLGCPAGYCREEWNLSHPDLVGQGGRVLRQRRFERDP